MSACRSEQTRVNDIEISLDENECRLGILRIRMIANGKAPEDAELRGPNVEACVHKTMDGMKAAGKEVLAVPL